MPSTCASALMIVQHFASCSYLSNNNLTSLPGTVFSGSTSLHFLYESYLFLAPLSCPSMLQLVYFALTIVQHVMSCRSLNNNNLTKLPGTVFSGLASLSSL
jgi:succinate-acetate transporter protein